MLVKAGSGLATFGEPSSAGVPKGFADLTTVISLDDPEALERVFAEQGQELAAAIIEPIPANNGLLVQDRDFLLRLRELCTRHGAALIFDEVISGFRVAPGGASELFGITPDLVTYGKIIGGGMPVGLYGGRKDIMGVISPDGPVYQAGTLSGNPVAMAAGLATLERLTPALYRDLDHKAAAWAAAFETIPGLHAPRVGSLLWPLFQAGVKRADRVESGAIGKFNRLHGLLLEQGIYLPPSGFEVAFLSVAHGEEELAELERAAAAVANQMNPMKDTCMTAPLVRALKGEVLPTPPVWFMRQAGRFLPEYRALREQATFEQVLYDPDLAAEVTLQPVRRFPNLDGAIIFSDILVILDALGCGVVIPEGGPRLSRTLDQLDPDGPLDLQVFEPVQAALRKVRAELPERQALLGFAGAPLDPSRLWHRGEGEQELDPGQELPAP